MVVYFYFKIRYKSAQPINRKKNGILKYLNISSQLQKFCDI